MASVSDVFKQLEREQQMQTFAEGEETIDSNNYCMLESDTTRKILIPEKYSIFGVESDEKSNRIKFKFPQHVNDIDLSELSLRINYRNANGEIDQNLTENKETTDDRFVTFEWVLTRKVTAYMGDVDFIVCAIKTQPDGTLTNEWNTTIATAQTLEGLEPEPVTEEETEQARDLLTQLLSVMLSVKTDSVQAVNDTKDNAITEITQTKTQAISDVEAEGQTQISAVDAKGGQVLESIPDDYTQLQEQINTLFDEIDEQEKLFSNGKIERLNKNNIIPDLQIKDNSLWGSTNLNISFVDTGKLSNAINIKRLSASESGVLRTIIPYSKLKNGEQYRISFDCGHAIGSFKVTLRENKGILGQNLNNFFITDALMIAEGTYRYYDFTFDNQPHTEGYNYAELQIILQNNYEYNISEIYLGITDNGTDYSEIVEPKSIKEINEKLDELQKGKNASLSYRTDSVITNFDVLDDWSFSNLTNELKSERYTGDYTIHITCPSNSLGCMYMNKNFDFSDKCLSIMTFCENVSNLNGLSVLISLGDTTYSKSAYFYITPEGNHNSTWQKHTITPLDWELQNATLEDLKNVKSIRFNLRANENGPVTVGLDNFGQFKKDFGAGVLFLFDDGYTSVFDNAMPAFDKYGYVATSYLITDFTEEENPNHMSKTQLRILRDKGWTIGSHTTGHAHLSSVPIEEADISLKNSHEWLKNNGFFEGSYHVAYPFGEYNPEVKENARKYYKTAFVTKERWFPGRASDKMAIPRFSITKQKYTIEEVKSKLQKAKDNEQIIIMYFHIIGTHSEADWTKEEFFEIVDFVHELELPVMSVSDLNNQFDFDKYDNY